MKTLFAAAWLFISLVAGAQTVTPPPIAARAYIVLDAQSGATLAAAAENDRFEPASLTKLMTAWLTFEAIRAGRIEPNRMVTISEAAAKAGGARMFLIAGQQVALPDLLRGMVVQSANDAALALAEAVGGSEVAFVTQMNAQAARLGLRNTHFA